MYQWRFMKSQEEYDLARKVAKSVGLKFIKDINLDNISDPLIFLTIDYEMKTDLNTDLSSSIELLKNSDKRYFEFNQLMFCKLYPASDDKQDIIVVMDCYWDDIRNIRKKDI